MAKLSVLINALKTAKNCPCTHAGKLLTAIFLAVFSIFSFYYVPSFATNVDNGEDATCDEDTLESPTGPVRLRAEFTPEVINLHWYDENNNRITVSNSSNTCTYDTAINLPTNPTKTGYKFKGWKVMPDTAIEYIQTTATQYINTGHIHADNETYEIDFMVDTVDSNYRAIIGAASTGDTNKLYVSRQNESAWFCNSGFSIDLLPLQTRKNIRIVQSDGTANLYINNVLAKTMPVSYFGSPLMLFARNSTEPRTMGKIYGAKIYNNSNTLVQDLVPAKDADGVACMYDKVSGQYFYNAGTGDFIAGPDL